LRALAENSAFHENAPTRGVKYEFKVNLISPTGAGGKCFAKVGKFLLAKNPSSPKSSSAA